MDFVSTTAPPVTIKIDGTAYKVPRFLNDQFAEWAAMQQQKIREVALAQIKDDERRAQFYNYHQPPPLDIVYIGQQLTTPEGAKWLVREQLGKAGVPAERIDGMLANTDPILIRGLADEIRSGNGMLTAQAEDSGDPGVRGNPSTGQPHTSGGLPETTHATLPTGLAPTPDENQAA